MKRIEESSLMNNSTYLEYVFQTFFNEADRIQFGVNKIYNRIIIKWFALNKKLISIKPTGQSKHGPINVTRMNTDACVTTNRPTDNLLSDADKQGIQIFSLWLLFFFKSLFEKIFS